VIGRVLCDVLEGLEAAHELRGENGRRLGLVHRDVSPQNVLVGTDGVARLSDFGIARATTRLSLTQTGIVKGKVGYMSPEQARGRELDQRCDVWAAGVIAWELFAGRRLIDESDPLYAATRLFERDPPLLRSVRPDISPGIEEAVAFALSVDLERRCPTARQFAKRLSEAVAPAERAEVAEVVAMLTELVREERSQALEHRAPLPEPEPTPEPISERVSGVHATSAPPPRQRRLWIAGAGALVAIGGVAFALSLARNDEAPSVDTATEAVALEQQAPPALESEPEADLHADTVMVPAAAPLTTPASASEKQARPVALPPPAPKPARPRRTSTAAAQSASKPKTPPPLKLQPNPY
jgi:serine/threonine protein kinase